MPSMSWEEWLASIDRKFAYIKKPHRVAKLDPLTAPEKCAALRRWYDEGVSPFMAYRKYLGFTEDEHLVPDFDGWLYDVKKHFLTVTEGAIDIEDIADMPYREWFDDAVSPAEAADMAYKRELGIE